MGHQRFLPSQAASRILLDLVRFLCQGIHMDDSSSGRRAGGNAGTDINQRALMLVGLLAMVVLHASAAVGAQAGFVSARYVSGDLPVAPALAVSGGEVFLEVLVAVDGRVDAIRTLRTTPPFTEALIEAVRGWRFKPATQATEPSTGQTAALTSPQPVASPILVAAIFTPPALNGPTSGQSPRDVLFASDETPMPTVANPPVYPPHALRDGTVLVELTIADAGFLTDAQVRVPSPAFDAAALAAARSWSFRTARRHGNAVTTHAYLLVAFRQPVIGR
jgi:TonB family protein